MTRPRTAVHPASGRRRTVRRAPSRRGRPARRPAARRPVAGARRRKNRRKRLDVARWWPALLVAVAVFVGVAWDSVGGTPVPAPSVRCTLPVTGLTLTGEQLGNARTIAAVAYERGLPDRAVVIAIATAMQESRLRNLDYGDRDSLGLFQQRPSTGWGTPEQVRDPVYAAGKFYDGLVQVPSWQTGELTVVADAVQRSAFPRAYQRWEPMAQEVAAALRSEQAAAFGCGATVPR